MIYIYNKQEDIEVEIVLLRTLRPKEMWEGAHPPNIGFANIDNPNHRYNIFFFPFPIYVSIFFPTQLYRTLHYGKQHLFLQNYS